MSEMSKSCLLNCVISALKETNLKDFEIGTELDAIRFSVDGHKVRVTVRGSVESVDAGVLVSDLPAKLIEILIRKEASEVRAKALARKDSQEKA